MNTRHRRHRTGMEDDALIALLHGADAAPPPTVREGLADRVRTRARQRQRRRRMTGGVVVAVAAVAGILMLVAPPRTGKDTTVAVETPVPPDPVRLAAEMKAASLEAEVRLAVVRRAGAREYRRAQQARLERALERAAETSVEIDPVAAQRTLAAWTMVDHADRLHSRAGRLADALAAYRRAVELFPETPSAEVARRRIEQLRSQNKT